VNLKKNLFEYMSGGSVYDYMRREGALNLTQVWIVLQ
jgi:hypothetical protein